MIITSGVVVGPPGIGTEEGVIDGEIGADGEDTIGAGTEDGPTDGGIEGETDVGDTDVGATDVGSTEVGAGGVTVTLVGVGVCGWQTSLVQVTVSVTTIVLVPVIG